MDTYRRKAVKALLVVLFLFSAILLFGLFAFKNNIKIFDFGVGAKAQALFIMVLSAVAILRVIQSLADIESKEMFKKRVMR